MTRGGSAAPPARCSANRPIATIRESTCGARRVGTVWAMVSAPGHDRLVLAARSHLDAIAREASAQLGPAYELARTLRLPDGTVLLRFSPSAGVVATG